MHKDDEFFEKIDVSNLVEEQAYQQLDPQLNPQLDPLEQPYLAEQLWQMGQSTQTWPLPFENTYWVKPGLFLAGCYPGTPCPTLIESRLQALLDAGVRTIISLMEDKETYADGKPFVRYEKEFYAKAAERHLSVVWHNCPVPDFGLPSPEKMRDILSRLNATMQEEEVVYLHCWGGKGRTGTVVGCWLAENGEQDPLAKLNYLRRHCPNAKEASPETPEQCQMVKTWGKL